MNIRAFFYGRDDWENCTNDPDTGNYFEFLPLSKRLKYGGASDGLHNIKRMIRHRNILEIRWIRLRLYKWGFIGQNRKRGNQ